MSRKISKANGKKFNHFPCDFGLNPRFSSTAKKTAMKRQDDYVNEDEFGSEEEVATLVQGSLDMDWILDEARHKSDEKRVAALKTLVENFKHQSLSELIESNYESILEVIGKSLKRDKKEEKFLASQIAVLMVIQLQGDNGVVSALNEIFGNSGMDNSTVGDVKTNFLFVPLSPINFCGRSDLSTLIALCSQYERFSAKTFKKEGKFIGEEKAAIAAAINSWTLLLTLIPSGDVVQLLQTKKILHDVNDLIRMLSSEHFEIRMAAGNALAVLLESGRKHNEGFLEEHLDEIMDAARDLATESGKFRVKDQIKLQKDFFKDFSSYLEDCELPEFFIDISSGLGKEEIVLDSWAVNFQYKMIRSVLGNATDSQLLTNDFLRDLLNLDEKPTFDTIKDLDDIQERSKVRSKKRTKNRDYKHMNSRDLFM